MSLIVTEIRNLSYISPSLYAVLFSFCHLACPRSTLLRKQMILLVMNLQTVHGNLTLPHSPLAQVISSHGHLIVLHLLEKKGVDSTIRYVEREREKIHITFIIVYYYNCSTLSVLLITYRA